jgi:hypothetical protein
MNKENGDVYMQYNTIQHLKGGKIVSFLTTYIRLKNVMPKEINQT